MSITHQHRRPPSAQEPRDAPPGARAKVTRSFALCILVLVGSLAACSTVMPAPEPKFLSAKVDAGSGDQASSGERRATVAIDSARAQVGEVAWLAAPETDLTADERDQLVELLRAQLRASISNLPSAPSGRPVVLRAAITRVETVSPALNAVSTLLLVAPWDRGGAAIEIEAVDAETGKQLAALRVGYFAPLSDIKARFIKLGPAEIAIKKAVMDFGVLLLQEPPTAKLAQPQQPARGDATQP